MTTKSYQLLDAGLQAGLDAISEGKFTRLLNETCNREEVQKILRERTYRETFAVSVPRPSIYAGAFEVRLSLIDIEEVNDDQPATDEWQSWPEHRPSKEGFYQVEGVDYTQRLFGARWLWSDHRWFNDEHEELYMGDYENVRFKPW